MAGHNYMDGSWVSQGIVAQVNEEQTEDPTSSAAAGAVRQFVAGQLGKTISLTDPTNAGSDVLPKTYQYVQRHPDSTTDLAPGTVMYWVVDDGSVSGFVCTLDDFVVIEGDAVVEGAVLQLPAGIFLGDDTADLGQQGVQPGNFGFIQIGGVANCLVADGGATLVGSEVESLDGERTVTTKINVEAARIGVAVESFGPNGAGDADVLLDLASLTVSQ